MTTHENATAVILVPGYWLGSWAWDEVAQRLRQAGQDPISLTLPGLDPDDPQRASRTLDEQAAAIEEALRLAGATHQRVVLVAHSGANGPVSLVLDRHPELASHVVWVDSGPAASGSAFAAGLPDEVVELPLPAFEELSQQASIDGLDAEALAQFRERAIPEPAPVARQAVELGNDQRWAVPTTLVCCSISGDQIMEIANAGHPMFAEVASLQSRRLVDLPTGHWPMWSRPEELARIIAEVAASTEG